jgi:membrane protein DedA with SNARE-associated domain
VFVVDNLASVIATHGYWVVAAVVALESMGLPLPGETTLVMAAAYAGKTHELNIALVIAAAATGAIVGDSVGFAIGGHFGYRLLVRYGPLLRISVRHIKLGQFLFHRHGGKVVFFGRFIAVLRALAALLAGMNCMAWRRFVFFNATGGIVWATVFGLAAYWLGAKIGEFEGPFQLTALGLAVIAGVAAIVFVRRHQAALEEEAERALPGPLRPPGRTRRRDGAPS